MSTTERVRLERIADRSLYSCGVMETAIHHCFGILRRHLRPGPVLELGPAEGVMTDLLATVAPDLSVVEGSARFCTQIAARLPQVRVHHALFEDFEPTRRYRTIVLGHVLEHVDDPVALLRRVARWLDDAAEVCVFAAVPNARSLHRQAAVGMGLLPSEDALNSLDVHHGHRRVFSPETLRSCFVQAGLKVRVFGGYWLKPVHNSHLEQHWTPAMLQAFMELGERYPDIAGEIYVVAQPG